MMDAKNFEYLSKKVYRYEQLEGLKDKLNSIQKLLVRDFEITIKVGGSISVVDRDEDFYSLTDRKLAQIEEHDDLMREIKDNLIDAIGMKLIEIEEKMEEL